jgi:hypothetical protein
MNLKITIKCCEGEQSVEMKKVKKTKEEIEQVLNINPTFPCALCGKRKRIEHYEFTK